eukprot:scaffold6453_cov188-Prasinococcus_capsulatus_cf.AAC.1
MVRDAASWSTTRRAALPAAPLRRRACMMSKADARKRESTCRERHGRVRPSATGRAQHSAASTRAALVGRQASCA